MTQEVDRVAECQQRLAASFGALMAFALSQGWTRDEAAAAVSELVNDWYLDRLAEDEAAGDAAAAIERARRRPDGSQGRG